jgi:hypothetical protein
MLHLLSPHVPAILGYQPDVAQAVYNVGQAVVQTWNSFVQALNTAMNANCPCL